MHFPGSLWEGLGGGGASAGDWNQIESVITDWNTVGMAQDQEESKVNLTFHLFEPVSKNACWFLFMLFNFGFTCFLAPSVHRCKRGTVVNGAGLIV